MDELQVVLGVRSEKFEDSSFDVSYFNKAMDSLTELI